jgi:hypothetical protein
VKSFSVAIAVTNIQANTTSQLEIYGSPHFAVFGAFLPDKEVLFDQGANGQGRQRVIEGGPLAAGANVTLAYTDWRAQTIVNADSLNLAIGQGYNYSRTGEGTCSIDGMLAYVIQAMYSTDGGTTWQSATLDAVSPSDTLQDAYGRTTYQATLTLANGATDFRVAFHVQAILTASPVNDQYILQWYQSPNGSTYQLGQTYTLVDTWDNDATALGYYDFVVTANGQ